METDTCSIVQIYSHSRVETSDELAKEELLEISVNDLPYALCLRLPGDDTNLVKGYCFCEGLIQSEQDIVGLETSLGAGQNLQMNVLLQEKVSLDSKLEQKRRLYVSHSSTGLQGKTGVAEIFGSSTPVNGTYRLPIHNLFLAKEMFEARMKVFSKTGCTHACSLFSSSLKLLAFAEDVGRHNAFDKAIGQVLGQGLLKECVLGLVSSRLSFEMVQKARRVGIEVLAGFSAVTSMARSLAREYHMTLIGFLRDHRLNIYSHPERIIDG
jgi:FdhD protein